MIGPIGRPAARLRKQIWVPTVPTVLTVLLGAAAAGVGASSAAAQQPPMTPLTPLARPLDADASRPTDAVEKTVSFVFDEKPWKSVLDWFAKESGLVLHVSGNTIPQGSLTIKTDPTRKYTIAEVVDLLNESLAPQNMIILRRSQTFTVLPADLKIPKDLVPKITPEELARRGDTEMVEVTHTLKAIPADEILPQVQKLKGPFGEINSLGANTLIIQDTARNVRLIIRYLEQLEDDKKAGDQLSYQCEYVRVSVAADRLKTLLTDASTRVENESAPQQNWGGNNWSGGNWGGGNWPQDWNRGGGRDDRGRGMTPSPAPGARFKTVQIATVETTNTLLITGPADKIAAARNFLKEIDTAPPGTPKRVIGPAEFRNFAVPAGSAENMAKMIADIYKTSNVVRVMPAANKNEITVYAPPADLLDIMQLLRSTAEAKPTTVVEVIPINNFRDPKEVADAMKRLFPDTGNGPFIDPRTDPTPGIIVRGTPAQIDEVKQSYRTTFEDYGSTPGQPRPTMRMLTVDNGNAGVIADALAEMIRGTRNNPVQVQGGHSTPPATPPTSSPMLPAPGAVPQSPSGALPAAPPGMSPAAGAASSGSASMNYRRGSRTQPISAQIVDPQAPAQPRVDPTKKPLNITVVGGKIILASEDPELLDYASQLARLLVKESTTIVDSLFEIIPLQNCSAEEAAKTINELFNGPQQSGQGQAGAGGRGGGGGGGLGGLGGGLGLLAQFAGFGAAAPAAPTPGRVRVVAEKQSNSLIVVRASPADLALIRVLLEKAINKEQDVTAATYPKTHIIPLVYARADEVKATLSEVYANLMAPRGGAARQQFPFPFPFPQQPAAPAAPPQLTISVDERSNSLIVNCNDILHAEIVKLVKMIDDSAANQNEVVQVIKLNGIAPEMVDALIAAMNGQQPASAVRPGAAPAGNQGGFGGGMGGFPGGGMGGFPGGGMGGFGGNRGGGMGGFGGNRGGGMGGFGGNRGGGRNRAPDYFHDGGGGPDFFDDRDMEVPSGFSQIYDPENDPPSANRLTPVRHQEPVAIPRVQAQLASSQTEARPQPPAGTASGAPAASQPPAAGQPMPPGEAPPNVLPAPNDQVFGTPVPGTDAYVIRGRNQADVNALLRAIEFLRVTEAPQARITIQLIPMKEQDASAVVNILNTLFSRVQISGGTTTLAAQPGRFGLGGGGGLAALFGGVGLGGGAAQPIGSIFMLPLPRFNAILLAVPEARLPDVLKQIELLDRPNGQVMSPVAFPLKNQSAQNVSQQIQTFFNSRYTGETQQQNQIRVFFDANQNTVYVQASPADLRDVAEIIRTLDSGEHGSMNELRVFPLSHAFAADLAQVLFAALTSNAVNPAVSANAAGAAGGLPGQLGGPAGLGAFGGGPNAATLLGGQQGGAFGLGGGLGGQFGQVNFPTQGIATKSTAVRLFSRDGQFVDSGYLVDVHIIPDTRINSLVISAPAQTMRLIEKLILELDMPSAAAADVKVFTLKKSDATTIAQLLLQLFSRAQQAGGFGGVGGAFGGLGGQLGGQLGATAQPRPLLTLTGDISEGANLVDIRLAVDVRTNSIIVAGSPSDLDTIRAIVARLEDAEASQLITKVYKLRNNGAADVQAAVLAFMQSKLQAEGLQFQSVYQTLQQNIFLQAEPITNTLLLAVAPKYFHEVIGLIEKLDAPPTQVFVQVLIAEVQLRNTEEFGVEFGIQSPVLFARSRTGGTSGNPGFNFNTTAIPPQPTPADPGVVGFQGLGNLGVGRSGATGVGGFVFSAASDTFSLLVRALKAQSRIDVLSKPQLLLTDGQVGFFQVGQSFPINLGTTQSPNVGITANIQYIDIGITLRVTPRINPDGRVLMRVEPQITNPVPTPINLGNGVLATAFDQESLQTTVLASDGETVVLGGLIRRSDQKTENKIPVLGDIPYLGALFRYRTQQKERREVLFIITPHIIRNEADMARVGAVEICKMNWVYNDVLDVNTYGAALLNGQNPYEAAGWESRALALPPGSVQPPLPGGLLPDQGSMPGTPQPYPQSLPGGIVPDSLMMPGQPVSSSSDFSSLRGPSVSPMTPLAPIPPPRNGIEPAGARWPGTPAQQLQQIQPPAMPAEKPTEGKQWSVFGR